MTCCQKIHSRANRLLFPRKVKTPKSDNTVLVDLGEVYRHGCEAQVENTRNLLASHLTETSREVIFQALSEEVLMIYTRDEEIQNYFDEVCGVERTSTSH